MNQYEIVEAAINKIVVEQIEQILHNRYQAGYPRESFIEMIHIILKNARKTKREQEQVHERREISRTEQEDLEARRWIGPNISLTEPDIGSGSDVQAGKEDDGAETN